MYECIDFHDKAVIFFTHDTDSGALQIKIDKIDREKTAFSFHFHLFRPTRMPFGFPEKPVLFEQTFDIIVSTAKWQFALV